MTIRLGLGTGGVALPLGLLAMALLAAPGVPPSRSRLAGVFAEVSRPRATLDRRWVSATVAGTALGLVTWALLGGGAGIVFGLLSAGAGTLGASRVLARSRRTPADPLQLAGAWDLLAACLRAGVPVGSAVGAISEQLPAQLGGELTRISHLLALGADPAAAWRSVSAPELVTLAGAAARSATSGAALARLAGEAANDIRSGAADAAEARAQRAGVLITGPLGLCFLPAFICLGVIPVVIGLASELLARW